MIQDPSNMTDWTDVENIRPAEEPASAIDQKLCAALEAWPKPLDAENSANTQMNPRERRSKRGKSVSLDTESSVSKSREDTTIDQATDQTIDQALDQALDQRATTRLKSERRLEVGTAPTHGSNWNWDRGIAGALHLGVSSPVARESEPFSEPSETPQIEAEDQETKLKFFIPDSLIVTDPKEQSESESVIAGQTIGIPEDVDGDALIENVEDATESSRADTISSGEDLGHLAPVTANLESDFAELISPSANSKFIRNDSEKSGAEQSSSDPVRDEETVTASKSDSRSSQPTVEESSDPVSEPSSGEDEHEIDVIQSQDLEVIDAEDVLESEDESIGSSEMEAPLSENPPPLQRSSPENSKSEETSHEEIAGEDILEEEDWEEVAVEEVATSSVPPALNAKHGNNGEPAPPAMSTVPPPLRSPERRVHRSWHIDAFEEYFTALRSSDSMESAAKDAKFIDSCLGNPTSASLLDVACGDGRHSFAFADLGYQVTGMDNSAAQLRRAAAQNEIRTRQVSFVSADMRSIPDATSYDIVACLGSSLGYFDTDQNRMVLERMNGVLRPGGRMVLQVFNRDSYVSRLPCRSWWGGEGCLALDEVDFDFLSEQLIVNRTVVFEDGQQVEKRIAIHAYTLQELLSSLEALGLHVREISGSRYTRGCYYGAASPDIWLIAEKK